MTDIHLLEVNYDHPLSDLLDLPIVSKDPYITEQNFGGSSGQGKKPVTFKLLSGEDDSTKTILERHKQDHVRPATFFEWLFFLKHHPHMTGLLTTLGAVWELQGYPGCRYTPVHSNQNEGKSLIRAWYNNSMWGKYWKFLAVCE